MSWYVEPEPGVMETPCPTPIVPLHGRQSLGPCRSRSRIHSPGHWSLCFPPHFPAFTSKIRESSPFLLLGGFLIRSKSALLNNNCMIFNVQCAGLTGQHTCPVRNTRFLPSLPLSLPPLHCTSLCSLPPPHPAHPFFALLPWPATCLFLVHIST